MTEAWFMLEVPEVGADAARRTECRLTPNQPVSLAHLHEAVGLLHYNLREVHDVEACLQQKYSELGCIHRDTVTVEADDSEATPFFQGHSHQAPEIRYICAGSCYFDVRLPDGRWVRVKCSAGDLLVQPAGIHHRFSATEEVIWGCR